MSDAKFTQFPGSSLVCETSGVTLCVLSASFNQTRNAVNNTCSNNEVVAGHVVETFEPSRLLRADVINMTVNFKKNQGLIVRGPLEHMIWLWPLLSGETSPPSMIGFMGFFTQIRITGELMSEQLVQAEVTIQTSGAFNPSGAGTSTTTTTTTTPA